MDLQEAVRGSVNGERPAQRELFCLCRATVWRLVWRILGPVRKEQVDDVVQDALLQLYRTIGQFRWESSFDTWLYRIVARTCMDALRRKYRKVERAVDRSGDVDSMADPQGRPDILAEQSEVSEAVRSALGSIGDERRAVFVLVDMEGKSLEEAAGILGRPVGTVKSRLFRARSDLARILGPVLNEHMDNG